MNKRVRKLNKVREYKGDALAKFIAVLIFNDLETIQKVCSNRSLDTVARELGLESKDYEFEHPNGYEKGLANAYEVKLWGIFETEGLSAAIHFFKETVVKYHFEGERA